MGKVTLEPITSETIRKANERGASVANAHTAIMHADVETIEGSFHVRFIFRDGTRLSVPVNLIEELAAAKPEALRCVEIAPSRDAIAFPLIDADIYVPGLLSDLYGSRILAEKGRAGGRRSSPAKAAAVRENGRKGGRPRKKNQAA